MANEVSSSVVLISGASSGFGWLTSLELARRGHLVYGSMRDVEGRNATAREELIALAADLAGEIRVVELDVTDEASVERAVAAVVQGAGRIDVAVNNAGFGYFGLNETFTVEQVQRMFDTLVFGSVRVDRAVLPHMRAAGTGLLVQMTSVIGRLLFPFTGIYAAAKHATEALATSYRFDLAPIGIDSVIIEPGAFPTRMNELENVIRGDDAARAQGYGDHGMLPEQFLAASEETFMGEQPDPQDVAVALADLIETPVGHRPLRTTVGVDAEPLRPLNELSDQLQRAMFEGFGIPHMLEVAPR